MEDKKYRIYFYRNDENKPFCSCICWSKAGPTAAEGYIKDLFKLKEFITLRAEDY